MRIVFINCSDSGSTGKIICDISEHLHSLKQGHETILCSPKTNANTTKALKKIKTSIKYEQGFYRNLNFFYGIKYGIAPLSTLRIKNVIKKHNPDVVHIHSANGYTVNIYSLMRFLSKRNIPTLITNHAEFFYTGNCSHAFGCNRWETGCGNCPDLFYASDTKLFDRTHIAWKKMKKAISNHKKLCVTSVSPWVLERSSRSLIMQGVKQSLVLNGTNVNIFKPCEKSDFIRKKLGIKPSTKIILQVTAHFSKDDKKIKGGYYFCELAKRFTGEDVCFVVVGKANETGEFGNIKVLGQFDDREELATLYSAADLCVVTSPRETFGMVVAESLCCGTPVVGFKSGGSESIAILETSDFVEFGDTDMLEKIVREKWLDFKKQYGSYKIADAAQKLYDSKIMSEKYLYEYNNLLK